MPDSCTGDDVEVPLDDSKLQKAVNDVKRAGLQITQDPTKTETVIPEMKDGMQKQLQGDMDSQATKIEQRLSDYEKALDAYNKARASVWNGMGSSVSGNASWKGSIAYSGIKNTQGINAYDRPTYIGGKEIYCTQPYGVGPGIDGVSTHVTLQTGIQGNADQQHTVAGIMYLGYGGPGNQGYSELETHLALSYYLYHNDLAHIKDWETNHEGVTEQVADQ